MGSRFDFALFFSHGESYTKRPVVLSLHKPSTLSPNMTRNVTTHSNNTDHNYCDAFTPLHSIYPRPRNWKSLELWRPKIPKNWIKGIQATSFKLASESILLVASTKATLLLFGERSSTAASSLGALSIWIVDFWEQAAGTNVCLVTVCNHSLAFLLNILVYWIFAGTDDTSAHVQREKERDACQLIV